jgi:hypothetical protein
MNRANPPHRDSKADNRKIATEKSANVSGASVKNKVAVNRAAVSKADDRTGALGINERREVGSRRFSFTCSRLRLPFCTLVMRVPTRVCYQSGI